MLYPNIAKDWNYHKNDSVRPEDILPNSRKKVEWYYAVEGCGYEWDCIVVVRTTYSSPCPACARRVIIPVYNLKILHPEIAMDWDYSANGEHRPEDFLPGLNKNVTWSCTRDGFKWSTTIKNRTSGSGCPGCAKLVPIDTYNLSVTHPEIAAEWHSVNKLTLRDVTRGSNARVTWQCKENSNHVWKTAICNCTCGGTGCPHCIKLGYSKVVIE